LSCRSWYPVDEDFKLEKGATDKAKEPDPGGSDHQNLGFKKLKNRKTDRTVGLNFCQYFQYFVRHGLTSSENEPEVHQNHSLKKSGRA